MADLEQVAGVEAGVGVGQHVAVLPVQGGAAVGAADDDRAAEALGADPEAESYADP